MRKTDLAAGQILPVLLAMIAIGLSALMIAYRGSQAIGQQSVVVNAADAAAYSGANWTARRLNFMAYTNRAMLANHIAVGHLVAYISWLRYVEGASAQIARYSSYLPYVGTATRAANTAVRTSLSFSEQASWGFINGVDVLHGLMSTSQLDARRGLLPDRVDEVMRQVGKSYQSELKINRGKAIESVPQPYEAAVDGMLAAYRVGLIQRVQSDTPGRDEGYFERLLSQSIEHDDDLARWLQGQRRHGRPEFGTGGRTWSSTILRLIRFRKQGVTNQAPVADAGGWRSADRLQVSFFDFSKFSWESWDTLASGRASANQLAGNYDGIDRYTRLATHARDAGRFQIPAIATLQTDPPAVEHAHLSVAEVIHQPPADCDTDCPRLSAEANLFNPYWRASLDAPDLLP